MELRLLRYFVAVAEELNITRAAERLHTAQPSLSQQIRQLELILGIPLFYRNKHHLELTEAGRVFLGETRTILKDVERAITLARQAARAEAGQLTLAMVPGLEGRVFSRTVPTLLRNYPDIQIILRSLTSPQQIVALQKKEINVGFLRGPIEDEEIASEVIMREKVVAVMPAGHDLAKMQRVSVTKLASLPLIQISRAIAPTVHDVANVIEKQAGTQFKTLLETEDLLTSLNAVASGLGFSFFAEYVEQILPKGVVARPLDLAPVPELELLVAYRKDDRLPALGFFLSLLRESVKMDFNLDARRSIGDAPEKTKAASSPRRSELRSSPRMVSPKIRPSG